MHTYSEIYIKCIRAETYSRYRGGCRYEGNENNEGRITDTYAHKHTEREREREEPCVEQ